MFINLCCIDFYSLLNHGLCGLGICCMHWFVYDICDNVKAGTILYGIVILAFVAMKPCIIVYDFCYVLRFEKMGVSLV